MTVGPTSELISIVDADPDLGELLDDAEREKARRQAVTRVRRLSPGEWKAAEALEADVHHQGFLVIDGLLSREVEVLGRRAVELIGDADVLRPGGGIRRVARERRGRAGSYSSRPGWRCSITSS